MDDDGISEGADKDNMEKRPQGYQKGEKSVKGKGWAPDKFCNQASSSG